MSDQEFRVDTLHHIYNVLRGIVVDPPIHGYSVHSDAIVKKLQAIDPFWEAYKQTIRYNTQYAVRNLGHPEQETFIKTEFLYKLLDAQYRPNAAMPNPDIAVVNNG